MGSTDTTPANTDRELIAGRHRRNAEFALEELREDLRGISEGMVAAARQAVTGLYRYGTDEDLELANGILARLCRRRAERQVDRVVDVLNDLGAGVHTAYRTAAAEALLVEHYTRELDELNARRRNMGGDR